MRDPISNALISVFVVSGEIDKMLALEVRVIVAPFGLRTAAASCGVTPQVAASASLLVRAAARCASIPSSLEHEL